MKLLLTSAATEIGEILSEGLSGAHEVVLTERPGKDGGREGFAVSELGHDDSTNRLVRGLEGVVHIGFGGHGGDAAEQIDYLTRCTYNLLAACVAERVPRVVYLSTLRLMDGYEEHLTVTERWRSLPTTDTEILAAHLGEYVCREFAREHPLTVVALRLGFPLVRGSRTAAQDSGEPAALASADLVRGVEAALVADTNRWEVVHLQSPVTGARFLTTAAEEKLGSGARPREETAR